MEKNSHTGRYNDYSQNNWFQNKDSNQQTTEAPKQQSFLEDIKTAATQIQAQQIIFQTELYHQQLYYQV